MPAGIAVIRVSGPGARRAVSSMAGFVPAARQAAYARLRSTDGSVLDTGIVIFFPAPASFTGEDCAEFQVHGGRAVVAAIMSCLLSHGGYRVADAGEFTRRAFQNGKMSLTDAEAFADLVTAETEAQRRFAITNAAGPHAALYAGWRSRILHARAMIEAEIDFAEEEDIPGSVAATIWQDMARLQDDLAAHVAGYGKAEIVRGGFDVVIAGAPNAGKSSLLNALAKRDAAIVSNEPGTTRDLIEVALDLDGIKVRLTDTAGLREETSSAVERIGIQRAKERAKQADLVLFLEDMAASLTATSSELGPGTLRIGTKADLRSADVQDYDLTVSVKTGEGIDRLLREVGRRAASSVPAAGEIVPWRLRQVEQLQSAEAHLGAALAGNGMGLELRAEELRLAGTALAQIIGAVQTEELLDAIFSQFCVGK